MLHYYLNVYQNWNRAYAISKSTKEQLDPFDRFLEKSIKALEKKQVEAAWEKVETQNLAELRLVGGLYKYTEQTGYYRIELLKGEPNFNKQLEYQIGSKEGSVTVTKEAFEKKIVYIGGNAQKFDAVKWGFADVELCPAWDSSKTSVPDHAKVIKNNGNETIFYMEKQLGNMPDGVEQINSHRAKEFADIGKLVLDSDETKEIRFERAENTNSTSIILEDAADYEKTVRCNNGLRFKIFKPQQSNADNWKIQLKEVGGDTDSENELYALSPLRYFFSDNVEIKDNKSNKYSLDNRNSSQEELQIVLRKKDNNLFCHPEGSSLTVQVDVRQLERQRSAISKLKLMPHTDHENLIQLFEKKSEVRWKPPQPSNIDKWFVLKDETRSGCKDQRDFVAKALGTPDFAILEGPPGAGKTTVILELICQIVSRKQRVLLCGSTNVAIDNVLERLIEERNGGALLEQAGILPVRIGHPDRVSEAIEAYQIDHLVGDDTPDNQSKKQRLLLAAANLVCGTTMGIINHPQFREQDRKYDQPVVPDFDFLIIDESSKTTFQEFLVPALYAKRWILAGDVMQLSPFTDQEAIEDNFEQIAIDGKALDKNIQQAVFYLEQLSNYLYAKNKESKEEEYRNLFIMPCSASLISAIVNELHFGRIEKFTHEEIFICITAIQIQQIDHDQIILCTPDTARFLELTAANVIFVDSSVLSKVQDKLPPTHAVLRTPDWETMPHAFCHNAHRGKFGYFQKGKNIADSFELVNEINSDFKERSWAKEIAWRINSENQLRLAKGNKRKEKLGSEIDEYTPSSVKKESFENVRDTIAAMSFPSILESLVTGIKGKKTKSESTISDGFNGKALDKRKTTLTYQHRMHPDISAFPRSRYYQESKALLDLESPKSIREMRNWSYNRYDCRKVWVNVDSPTKGGKNIFEAAAMVHHLKEFLNYAVKNEHPEKGKNWEVACLAFYRGQEGVIREGGEIDKKHVGGLLSLPGIKGKVSSFRYNEDKRLGDYPVFIRLCSVDRFQGHEADVVFLSMSQTNRDGFLDNPNRLNVAITRAKFQLVIFGKYEYFSEKSRSEDLGALAQSHKNHVEKWSAK